MIRNEADGAIKWVKINAEDSENPENKGFQGGDHMKGYYTASGYMGYVEGEYILFASEEDYWEYLY